MRAWGTTVGVPLLLAAALAGCGQEPTLSAAGGPSASASAPAGPTATASAPPAQTPAGAPDGTPGATPVDGSSGGAASAPAQEPTAAPTTPPAGTDGPDLDGDGRGDSVSLLEVPGTGWSFDVRLADGRETSAPLPDDTAVHEDVAVLGAVDLDQDGADEVLVRTLRAVGGENAVVFRLDEDGVWLVRDREDAPFELSTSGGMTGPRSWACADGEVLTRESERQPDGTYRATTWRWALLGHVAGPLGAARDDALPAEQVALDPSTCAT